MSFAELEWLANWLYKRHVPSRRQVQGPVLGKIGLLNMQLWHMMEFQFKRMPRFMLSSLAAALQDPETKKKMERLQGFNPQKVKTVLRMVKPR